MNFINNWIRDIELEAGVTSCPLDLPDGTYRLTITDAARTRWEIVDAEVAAGEGSLTRAVEGTTAQDWDAGSVIFSALTAGLFAEAFSLIRQLEARVAALENPFPVNALVDQDGEILVNDENQILTTGEGQ